MYRQQTHCMNKSHWRYVWLQSYAQWKTSTKWT